MTRDPDAAAVDSPVEDASGLLHRWRERIASFSSRAEIEAVEERAETRRQGTTAVAELIERRRAVVSGVLRSVTLRPRTGVPALEAALFDGSGSLDLVWLGRREIAGVEPGRRLRVSGLVCLAHGRPTMFNPRYELKAHAGE
jgi:hypothetical protein